jgi:hypothetical protein
LNKKINIFLIFMLLIIYTIPVFGFTGEQNNITISFQEPNQNYRSKVKYLDDGRQPPIPGEIPSDFVFETERPIRTISNPPKKTSESSEEAIIEIIENMDEDLYLEYLDELVAFGPRPTGSNACENAGDYIYEEFVSDGLVARYDDWSYGSYSSYNIEATLPGIDQLSDEIYIICAHYDTVSVSPGADDDGSGTVAVLAAAYLMSQYEFNHTIRFVAFSGEEQGLLGSEAYVAEAFAEGWNIVGVLNTDMISYAITENNGDNLIVYENSASEWLYTYTNNVNTKYSSYIDLILHHGGSTWGSDHNSFWDYGYNALFYFEYTETPYYHTSGDTIEHINATYAKKNARLIYATLAELAEAQPLSKPPATPTKPDGPEVLIKDVEATFESTTIDPEGEQIYYMFDWGDGNFSDWIGPYASGETGEASHNWSNLGDYEVRAIAKDIHSVQSNWSEPHIISIIENLPPANPTIKGPSWGLGGKKYDFTFISSDPNGHNIYYKIDWDDDSNTGWIGPFNSGEVISLNHSWNKKGEYLIKAWAKDIFGGESGQASFRIKILTNDKSLQKNKGYNNQLFIQLLEKLIDRFPLLERLFN